MASYPSKLEAAGDGRQKASAVTCGALTAGQLDRQADQHCLLVAAGRPGLTAIGPSQATAQLN